MGHQEEHDKGSLDRTLKQVDRSHYDFVRYMSKERWASVWHQIHEIHRLGLTSVLEIGAGAGVLKRVAEVFGIRVETADIDPDLKPDHLASVTALPFSTGSYEAVCAFQVLEHMPYAESLAAFREMARVSKSHVLISLPDARPVWGYSIQIPKLGTRSFLVPKPQLRMPEHTFDGEHYWEINKRGFPLEKVLLDFSQTMKIRATYRVLENPSHRFLLFCH